MPSISSAGRPVHPHVFPGETGPTVDAAEAVRWVAIWLAAINAKNARALIDAQRTLRGEFGISICMMGRATKEVR